MMEIINNDLSESKSRKSLSELGEQKQEIPAKEESDLEERSPENKEVLQGPQVDTKRI